ncbi:MAG: zinc ribbon domain-containing protein [Chloroflexota bacterium]|nr:zinc ribbon domain-containing protein [Chloroflexota bacterium]
MHTYDYRCNACGRELSLTYKTYAEYDTATHTCPHCGSTDLTRLISRVTMQGTTERRYDQMSSGEMLSVLEGGNRHEVDAMYRQLGQDPAALGKQAEQIKKQLSG